MAVESLLQQDLEKCCADAGLSLEPETMRVSIPYIGHNYTLTIQDDGAYGAIVIQGHGTMAGMNINSPSMIRFGQMTEDEVFVAANAARDGIRITNDSEFDNLVMLKHFGPRP